MTDDRTPSEQAQVPVDSGHDNPCLGQLLDLNGVETFKFLTVLAYRDQADRPVRLSPEKAQFVASNPVKVQDGGGRTIGHALVFEDSGRCMAQIFLRKDCPERFDIEQKTRRLWPCAWFRALRFGFNNEVEVLQVTSIYLHDIQPDSRIPPCGEPVL